MGNITSQILDSVTRINRGDWSALFGDIPEGYNYYRVLEDSGLKEFSFSYLTLNQGQRIILIAPLFIAEFNLDIAVDGWLKGAIKGIRRIMPKFLVMRTLFCGSPFGEHGVVGIAEDMQANPVVFKALVNGLEEFRKRRGASLIVFKDFPSGSPKIPADFKEKGFFRVNSFPCASSGLGFDSFEGYLKSLGHSTRKNLRRKIKSAYSGAAISVKETDRIDNVIDDIYRLYLQTHQDGGTKFEKLTKEFFLKVAEEMKPHVKYFLYYVNGSLGAFNLCFVYKDLFIDKFIGFDYDISHKHNLYFVSWCYNVEWCIKNSIPYYHTGQTDYGAKIRLGAKLIPLYAYLRHGNIPINSLLKFLALFLKPDNFDPDIQAAKDA